MSSKPRSEWTPAYRAKVERGEAKGLSRQAARGHKKQEHVTRKIRELAEHRLTSSQRQQIKKYSHVQAYRANADISEKIYSGIIKWAGGNYEAFTKLRQLTAGMHKQWLREVDAGTYDTRGTEVLTGLADMRKISDISWLYYH